MKVFFVGSKNMGVEGLNILFDFQQQGLVEIVGVVARHDDDTPQWYRSVSQRARELKLKLFMPQSLEDDNFLREVGELKPDIGLCCFYPRLFEKSFFSIPRCGFYNTHFSPLPKYRGALPIPYAIMNDEKEHGVTIHRITRGMDSGPIVAQAMVPIYPDDTGCDLYARLEKSGAPLFRETVRRFIEAGGKLPLRRQDKTKIISHVRSDFKSMEVDRQWNPKKIYNFVRAFDFPPFPLTYIMINNEKFYLALKPGRHSYAADAWKSKKFGKLELFMMREAN